MLSYAIQSALCIFEFMELFYQQKVIEAGLDEAGRGCLAGPVFAAAVIIDPNFDPKNITDSKLLKPDARKELATYIKKNALDFAIAQIDAPEIDAINILNASFKAMHLCVDQLQTPPALLLIDGNRFIPYLGIPHQCIVKGDLKYISIAAASILAKVSRDEYMEQIGKEYPYYGWNQNKGYPTKFHKESIKEFGLSPYHRKSFKST